MFVSGIINILCMCMCWMFSLIHVYMLALLSDMESNIAGPIEVCNQINLLIFPEIIVVAVINAVLLFLLPKLAIIYLPLTLYGLFELYKKTALYDSTKIFGIVSKKKKGLFIKLGFFIVCSVVHLTAAIISFAL